MKIVIAPDSFKESLTAKQVAQSIARGVRSQLPEAELVLLPMADGGEGTTQALVEATGGCLIRAQVTDPLGRTIQADWGMLGDGETAVIETAAASGLDRLAEHEKDPLKTSSAGTGQLILAALNQGVKRIILGLGGSATNDGGSGLLSALGGRLLDAGGQELTPGGGSLLELDRLDLSTLDPRLAETEFLLACDVDNPLTGPEGASAVFGPQKGATAPMVDHLDRALGHFATHLEQVSGSVVRDLPGAGAAGGLGIVLMALASTRLNAGVELVMDAVGLDHALQGADLVITGEGRMDSQSIYGKTPIGVAQRAKRYDCRVIALAGSVAPDADVVFDYGIDALFSVVPGVQSLETALAEADENICRCARNIAAVWAMSAGLSSSQN